MGKLMIISTQQLLMSSNAAVRLPSINCSYSSSLQAAVYQIIHNKIRKMTLKIQLNIRVDGLDYQSLYINIIMIFAKHVCAKHSLERTQIAIDMRFFANESQIQGAGPLLGDFFSRSQEMVEITHYFDQKVKKPRKTAKNDTF